MKPWHDRSQVFLATLSENCPELPFEPTLLPQLFASTSDSSVMPLTHVTSLVEKSQGLAARILSIANSAYYGMQTAIASLPHAVRLLGLNEVRNIILQLGVTSVMRQLRFPKGFKFEELWDHKLRTANFAKEIALAVPEKSLGRKVSPDDIYAAGLLHDLGKTMLAANCPDDWLAIWDLAFCEQIPFYKAEEDYWGVDHSVAGERLLTFWGLPPNLTELVNWHHAPKLATEEYKIAAHVLAAANMLANQPLEILEEAFAAKRGGNEEKPLSALSGGFLPDETDADKLMKKITGWRNPDRVQGWPKRCRSDRRNGYFLEKPLFRPVPAVAGNECACETA
jgi:HD-like signal output (HDOD) protein